ncbi:glucose-6-phosphate isomerase [Candidatus Kapaibacterium sp.]
MEEIKTKILEKIFQKKKSLENISIKSLFEANPHRFEDFSFEYNKVLFDFSKNIIDEESLNYLIEFAEKSNLVENINDMFLGKKINFTENRAVLHTALRNLSDEQIFVDGKDISKDIKVELNKALNFAENLRNGIHLGCTGKKIKNVVNIGIGGSHLGPDMVCTALNKYSGDITVHFVSNVDPFDIEQVLKIVDPENTVFLIASKTFTTQETMANANKAKRWFLDRMSEPDFVAFHFAALSTNVRACKDFGVSESNIFGFWDWVGGRYSVWSVIGLSIAISIGSANFMRFLKGGYDMDMHFRNQPLNQNIPVLMALLGFWYNEFWNAETYAVIPYDQNLLKFSEFLQQLDMESNGKRINRSGEVVKYNTGPILWGTIGTNSQHSFFQLIHQGTRFIPVDFLACVNTGSEDIEQHKILLSNFVAQTEALMLGKSEAEVQEELKSENFSNDEIELLKPHKVFPGNKPTNVIIYNELTPETLGMLIALYEHKVFVQGVLWEINSFDQWGVELGKILAKKILSELQIGKIDNKHDGSTKGIMKFLFDNFKS